MNVQNCIRRLSTTTIRHSGIKQVRHHYGIQLKERCLTYKHIDSDFLTSKPDSHQFNNYQKTNLRNSDYLLKETLNSSRRNLEFRSNLLGNSKKLEINSYFLPSSSTKNRLFSSSAISLTSVTQNAEVLGSQQSADKLDNILQIPSLNNPDPSLSLAHDITPSVSDLQVAVDVIEPSLRSLGLCHWWPSGFMQSALEAIHINLDLSWGGTIILATILLRLGVFPLVIRSRKLMVKTNHHTPNLQQLQYKLHIAEGKQNKIAALDAFKSYQKEHGLSNFGSVYPLMLSGVCFSTMFFALRGMANLPVESLKEQGMGWFIDLTAPDPLFILPILTTVTIVANFKLGVDTSDNSQMPDFMKEVFRLAWSDHMGVMIKNE